MEKSLKLYTYINGKSEAFPNSSEQAEVASFTYNAARMGDAPAISFTLMHSECLDDLWSDKVYTEFNGEKYYLRQTPTSAYDNTDSRYKHTVDMVSERVALNDVYFFDVVSDFTDSDKPVSNSSNVVFFGDIHEFVGRLNYSLKYSGLDYNVVVDSGVESEGKLMSFKDQFFSNVLQEIYNTYELPYYFVGKTIHIGEYENEISEVFEYGSDKALVSVTKTNANFKIVNRCTGVGSSDNIPYYYPNLTPYGDISYLYNGSKSNKIEVFDWGRFAKCGISGELKYKKVEVAADKAVELHLEQFSDYDTIRLSTILDQPVYAWIGACPFSVEEAHGIVTGYIKNGYTDPYCWLEIKNSDNISIWRGSTIPENGFSLAYGSYTAYVTFGVGTDDYEAETTARSNGVVNIIIRKPNETKDSWTLNGNSITLGSVGVRFSGSPSEGDAISFRLDHPKMPVSTNLMPAIYRAEEGAERFYPAKNNTYVNEEGDYYHFENEFVDGRPKEHLVDFSDIKPTIEGMVNGYGQRIDMFTAFEYDDDDNDDIDEENHYKHPYFYGKLRRMNFNLFSHAIEGSAMTVSMTSGNCGACNWTIGVDDNQMNTVQVDSNGRLIRDSQGNVMRGAAQDQQNDTENNEVWVALKKEDSTFGILMPKAPVKDANGNINQATAYRPSVGDTFVLLNIPLPQEYILAAEERLTAAIVKYMSENNSEKFNFAIKLSRIYLAENQDLLSTLNENSLVKVKYNNKEYALHVTSYSYKMDGNTALPEITVELSDTLSVSRGALQNTINAIKGDIVSVKKESKTETQQIAERKANKATTLEGYGITNAFSRSEAKQEFMSTRASEEVTGVKDYVNGFKIGGILIKYDPELNALIFPTNATFEGGVSSYSTPEGFKPPTIMDAVIVDNVTIIKENGVLKLNGEIGGDGIDEESLQKYLTDNEYAQKGDIPKVYEWAQEENKPKYKYSEIEDTPTSLPASDVYAWAKAATKPTYKYSEISGTPTIPTELPNPSALKWAAGNFNSSSKSPYNGDIQKTLYIPTSVSHLEGGTLDGDLTVSGDFKASHITSLSTSDERLKKNIRPLSAFDILGSMGGVWQYEYKQEEVAQDEKNKGTHIGFIYQNVVKSLMSGMCEERKDGYGALNYHNSDYLALLAACNLELMKRVEALENKLNEKDENYGC